MIPETVAERQPDRGTARFERLAKFEEAGQIARDFVEASALHHALPIHNAEAHHGDAQCDPASVQHARALTNVIPTAVLLSEITCDLGQVDALVGILM